MDKENVPPQLRHRSNSASDTYKYKNPKEVTGEVKRQSTGNSSFKDFLKSIFGSPSGTKAEKKAFLKRTDTEPPAKKSKSSSKVTPVKRLLLQLESQGAIFYQEGKSQKEIRVPKCGTWTALLHWLILENVAPNYIEAFLLTYQNWDLSATDLFDKLEDLYNAMAELEDTQQNKAYYQKRVISFMAYWLRKLSPEELHYKENKWSNSVADKLKNFLLVLQLDGFTYDCRSLKVLLKKQAASDNTPLKEHKLPDMSPNTQNKLTLLCLTDVPQSRASKLKFTRFSPKQIARQMLNIEFSIFKKIQVCKECREMGWAGENKHNLAPNITALIERFNRVSYWVATTIVTAPTPRQQASMYKRFVNIAEECRAINNFNSLMEILAGLNMFCVIQLKSVESMIPEKVADSMRELEELMASYNNFSAYRKALNTAKENAKGGNSGLPILPYLGVFLKDITFCMDGNPDITEEGLYNFEKMEILAEQYRQLIYYQSQAVSEEEEDLALRNYLLNLVLLDEKTLSDIIDRQSQSGKL